MPTKEAVKLCADFLTVRLTRGRMVFSTWPTVKKRLAALCLLLLFALPYSIARSTSFSFKRSDFVNPNPSAALSSTKDASVSASFETRERPLTSAPAPTAPPTLLTAPASRPTASPSPVTPLSPLGDTFSVLLLGLDRRSAGEFPYRTDSIVLVTILGDKKKVLLTSIPRDLWVEGRRINAVYTDSGVAELKRIVKSITGLPVDRYLDCDFDNFVWAVNNFGGVEVNIERGFTDAQYPSDRDGWGGFISVSFEQGPRRLDGETALKYARSRHGNNGEGSDFSRSLRQQNLLIFLPRAILSGPPPFEPFSAQGLLDLSRRRGFKTDLGLGDLSEIYSILREHSAYQVSRFVLDYRFLYSPPMAQYGGAWVLLPKG